MTLGALLRYLFLFDRRAICTIAASKHAVWLGLLLVFSAAFAREYDGEDLLREPWHLLIPLGASLAVAVALFLVLWCACHGWKWKSPADGFRSFLALFWLTAPLAWLYAIPVERMFAAGDSVRANLLLLAVVAAWRVALITRVVTVLLNIPWWWALCPVMLLADTLMLTVLNFTPMPIIAVMGGVRLTDAEQAVFAIRLLTGAAGALTWLLWLGGTVLLCGVVKCQLTLPAGNRRGVSPGLWAIAGASLLVWAAVLPFTQPGQQRRWQVEHNMRSGDIEAGVRLMAAHQQSDFPPHWDPPPRTGYGEKKPSMGKVMLLVMQHEADSWVVRTYTRKYLNFIGSDTMSAYMFQMSDQQFEENLAFLETLPQDSPLIEKQRKPLTRFALRHSRHSQRIHDLLGIEEPPEP